MSKLQINITTAQIGPHWMAVTQLGGIVIRGQLRPTELEACQNLLVKLGITGEDDSQIALIVTLSGSENVAALIAPPAPKAPDA